MSVRALLYYLLYVPVCVGVLVCVYVVQRIFILSLHLNFLFLVPFTCVLYDIKFYANKIKEVANCLRGSCCMVSKICAFINSEF